MREEEARAAAARAAQPVVPDVKTNAPGAARIGWARVAAGPTASKGTPTPSLCPGGSSVLLHAGWPEIGQAVLASPTDVARSSGLVDELNKHFPLRDVACFNQQQNFCSG